MATTRVFRYDFARFIALVMVVAVHALHRLDVPLAHEVNSIWLLACNGIFFMLAGTLNVRVRDEAGTQRYYYHKFRNVLIPVVLYVLAIVLVQNRQHFGEPAYVASRLANGLLSDESYGYLWFVRTAFGLLLAAPFFAYITHAASTHDRRRFVVIGLSYLAARFVAANLGQDFSWGYPWGVWVLCFCIAPLCLQDERVARVRTSWLVAGALASFGAMLVLGLGLGWTKQLHDANPLYVVESVCLYLLLLRAGDCVGSSRVVSLLAGKQFPIYIVHMPVLEHVQRHVCVGAPAPVALVAQVIACVAVSLVVVLAFDTIVVHPVQRLLDKATKHS